MSSLSNVRVSGEAVARPTTPDLLAGQAGPAVVLFGESRQRDARPQNNNKTLNLQVQSGRASSRSDWRPAGGVGVCAWAGTATISITHTRLDTELTHARDLNIKQLISDALCARCSASPISPQAPAAWPTGARRQRRRLESCERAHQPPPPLERPPRVLSVPCVFEPPISCRARTVAGLRASAGGALVARRDCSTRSARAGVDFATSNGQRAPRRAPLLGRAGGGVCLRGPAGRLDTGRLINGWQRRRALSAPPARKRPPAGT
jgi:hypothetical protein